VIIAVPAFESLTDGKDFLFLVLSFSSSSIFFSEGKSKESFSCRFSISSVMDFGISNPS